MRCDHGRYVAARRALKKFGLSKAVTGSVAAVSVGIAAGEALLDLDYSEDSQADVDMNVVMTGETRSSRCRRQPRRTPLSRARLDELLELAAEGIEELAVCTEGSRCCTSRLASRSSPSSRTSSRCGGRTEGEPRVAQRGQGA